MNNLQEPISKDQKKYLEEELGLRAYDCQRYPNFADPDHPAYHLTSAVVLGLSFAGRSYASKIGVTRIPFTMSILMVPIFYYMAVFQKEKRFVYTSAGRRTFEQNLEFYPVTRRAWNRALSIRNSEIEDLKKKEGAH